MKNPKTKILLNKLPYGVYAWKTPEGILSDEDGNILSMEGMKGDLNAIKKMREAAAYYGYPEGEVIFLPGRRKITQSMHEDQWAAYLAGEELPFDVPDEVFDE